MTVSENIKRIRKERGLTQKKLGELCGIAEPNIRKYENGKQNPKLETVEKIASALGVTPFDLMGFDYWDQKSPHIGEEVAKLTEFESYLQSLGYSVKELLEGNNEEGVISCSYAISGNGINATVSAADYQQLQTSSGDLIFSFLWKKQQK
jgi:transcriptional regulator with XRE-family HTH domain